MFLILFFLSTVLAGFAGKSLAREEYVEFTLAATGVLLAIYAQFLIQ